jgi:DNA-binding transcriptional ArsR family regulator
MESAAFNEKIWFAIAEPSRRKLIDLLVSKGESSASKLAQEVTISRQAVTKHLAVLRNAGLLRVHRTRKEVLFTIDSANLNKAAKELSAAAKFWDDRLLRIKQLAEQIHEQE